MASRIFDVKRGVLSTVDGAASTLDIPVPTGTVIGFHAFIVPRVTSTNVGGLLERTGAIGNNSGTVALSGTPVDLASSLHATISLVTAVFTASSTNLRLTVTGVAAMGTIEWQYEIKLVVN